MKKTSLFFCLLIFPVFIQASLQNFVQNSVADKTFVQSFYLRGSAPIIPTTQSSVVQNNNPYVSESAARILAVQSKPTQQPTLQPITHDQRRKIAVDELLWQ